MGLAEMAAPNNLFPGTPELKDALQMLKKEIFLSLNCHALGQIQQFDPITQTAIVTISYKKTYSEPDPVTGIYANVQKDYPILAECPVITLGGGNGVLTFPITTGDDCLLFFNDRDIDNWVAGSTTSPTKTGRLHSFADAIALVGPRPITKIIASYSSSNIELRTLDGLTKVSIAEDGTSVTVSVGPLLEFVLNVDGTVTLTNVAGEFITALFQLLTSIQGATVLGVPIVLPPNFATNLAILGTFV